MSGFKPLSLLVLWKKRVATNPHLPAAAHAPVYWWPPHWFCSSPLHILYFSDSSYGAGGGIRTHTRLPSLDFESSTSTLPSHRQVADFGELPQTLSNKRI